MQDFHADCTINLLLGSQGNPAKFVWVCSLTLRKGPRLLTARRFVGIAQREKIEWEAVIFGLKQAVRFQQEKVQISIAAHLPGLNQPPAPRSRDAAIQALRDEAEGIWAGFRLKKGAPLDDAEAAILREELSLAFRRPRSR